MIKRSIIVDKPGYLKIRHQQLVVERDGGVVGQAPMEDIGLLILDHPQVTITNGVLTACAENNVLVVHCDGRHIPTYILQPLEGHSLHSKILQQQIASSAAIKKRLWQSIVQAKIRQQAATIMATTQQNSPLLKYAQRVKSGDSDNLEAQAAKIYWAKLFRQPFKRDPNGDALNSWLNYGYALIRAVVARAIVGAGLHPALGVFHCNQYNAFCLADDLMEPYRPLVDLRIWELQQERSFHQEDHDYALTQAVKKRLLELLTWPVYYQEREYPLQVACHHYAASVRRVLAGECKQVDIPLPK